LYPVSAPPPIYRYSRDVGGMRVTPRFTGLFIMSRVVRTEP
jgi:hypothetical protein